MPRLCRVALVAVTVFAVVSLVTFLRRTLPPSGTTKRTLSFGGRERSYLLYTGGAAKKSGLVVVLHGLNGNGITMDRRTNRTFDALADREGLVVLYPDAVEGRWSEGWADGPRGPDVDDVGFLSALIASTCNEFDIDPARAYATGFSNGASMVYRLACERENQVAAIAPVSGFIAGPVTDRCKDGRAIPLLVIHGTKDSIVPYESAVPSNLANWTKRNQCPPAPEITYLPDLDEHDGARVRLEHYVGCKDDSEISLYVIEGGGHRWPGDGPRLSWTLGNDCRDFEAASVIWEFFKRHALR